jgi:hypothetical protein
MLYQIAAATVAIVVFAVEVHAQERLSFSSSDTIAIAADDSTSTADADSVEEENEEDLPWTLTLQTDLEKTRIEHGVNLSGVASTSSTSATLLHQSGLHAGVAWSSMLGGDGGPLSWALSGGYDHRFFGWLDFTIGMSHTKYFSDSINPLTDLQNSLSLLLTADLAGTSLGLGYEVYFGTDAARYLSASLGHTYTVASLSITPTASLTYMAQRIDLATLAAMAVKLNKKAQTKLSGTGKGKASVSGVSSYGVTLDLHYDFGRGFQAFALPAYEVTPKGEVSSKDRQFLWSVGIEYAAEF